MSIDYELSYSHLVGTVQQAHIHFAQKAVNRSIVVWLCQTATTPAPPAVANSTPFCPQSGKVSGMITSANVIAAATASQMITAGELDEVIAAIRAGTAYANVHATPLNPGGEIRSQIPVVRAFRLAWREGQSTNTEGTETNREPRNHLNESVTVRLSRWSPCWSFYCALDNDYM